MKIETIRLKNYKAFQNVEIKNIPNLCVIVGANGVGKTTLFNLFGFLQDCLNQNVTKALQSRGGFKEVISRGHENETITIELQYRTEINQKERLVTYILEIGYENNSPFIALELLRYKRGASGSPFRFLSFKKGVGYAITNEEDYDKTKEKLIPEKQELEKSDILAIKGFGQFERFKAAKRFRQMIESWHISDFHIEATRGVKDVSGYAEHLSTSGDNLQLVANAIRENHPKTFEVILAKLKQRIPGIEDVSTELTIDGRLLLKFKDGSFCDPFIDRYVSDGTLKMFAYLTLLHDPAPHPLLCVEEPENQLYPSLMEELAEEFRAYTKRKNGGQVFISTHSPDFLNAIALNEVFFLSKLNGYAVITRAKDNEQIKAYMDDGDKMGHLWKQGFFKDIDPR